MASNVTTNTIDHFKGGSRALRLDVVYPREIVCSHDRAWL